MHGYLLIDKPPGRSSASIVGEAKRRLGGLRVGHTGTLDPMATGLLVLLVGEATRLASWVVATEKAYEGTMLFGEERSSDDREGEVIRTSESLLSNNRLTFEDLQRTIQERFLGEIDQVPPIISAVHVDGERAYIRARRGEEVVLQSRRITVSRYAIEKTTETDTLSFQVECSKGTYIRSLIRDLAREVGSAAHMTALRRTKTGKWNVADAIPPESISLEHIRPWPELVSQAPTFVLSDDDERKLSFGDPACRERLFGKLREGDDLYVLVKGAPWGVVWRREGHCGILKMP